MPEGSSAGPGWFVKIINEVIGGLGRVAAHLDDVIVFDTDPSLHVANMNEMCYFAYESTNIKLSL